MRWQALRAAWVGRGGAHYRHPLNGNNTVITQISSLFKTVMEKHCYNAMVQVVL